MVIRSSIYHCLQFFVHVTELGEEKNTNMCVGPVLPHVSVFNLLIMDD